MKRIIQLSLAISLTVLLFSCSDFDRFISGLEGKVVAPASDGNSLQDIEGLRYLALETLIDGRDPYYFLRDTVVVINDQARLKNAEFRGSTYSWPEINFKKYSLVIGKITFPDSGSLLAGQRIEKRAEALYFYPDIRSGGGSFTPEEHFIDTLYPKLPDLPVEIVRWNRD